MPNPDLSVKQLHELYVKACATAADIEEDPWEVLHHIPQDIWIEFARLVRDYTRSQT